MGRRWRIVPAALLAGVPVLGGCSGTPATPAQQEFLAVLRAEVPAGASSDDMLKVGDTLCDAVRGGAPGTALTASLARNLARGVADEDARRDARATASDYWWAAITYLCPELSGGGEQTGTRVVRVRAG